MLVLKLGYFSRFYVFAVLHIYSNLTFKSVNVAFFVYIVSVLFVFRSRCKILINIIRVKSSVTVFIFLYYLYFFHL